MESLKTDDECLYCTEPGSIDHTFNVIDWCSAVNNSNFSPAIEEKLFGIMSGPYDKYR